MATRGFTLVELLIVLAIAGLLAALAVPAVRGYIERNQLSQAVLDLSDMSVAIKQLERTTGALPVSLAAAGYGSKVDPWGNPYQYFVIGNNPAGARRDKNSVPINSDFDLYSLGKDGQSALQINQAVSRDDVLRARDGNFIGLASDFDPS